MTNEEVDCMRRISANRLRKSLFWIKKQGLKLPSESLKDFARSGLWQELGYARLLDCLLTEFEVPVEKAIEITAAAVKGGYEDERLYGIEQTAAQPAGQTDTGDQPTGESGVDSELTAAGGGSDLGDGIGSDSVAGGG
jgi:hypothetical protein